MLSQVSLSAPLSHLSGCPWHLLSLHDVSPYLPPSWCVPPGLTLMLSLVPHLSTGNWPWSLISKGCRCPCPDPGQWVQVASEWESGVSQAGVAPTPISATGSLPQGEAVAVVRETEQAASSSLHPAWIGYSRPGPAERPGACTHARTRGDTEHSKRPLSSLRWPRNRARKFSLSTGVQEPETPNCSPKAPQHRDVPPHTPSAPGALRWGGRHLWARPLPAGERQVTQT